MSRFRCRSAKRWICANATPHGAGFNAVVIRLRLTDGRLYDQVGKLNFVDNTIAQSTDTITLRGTIPNPPLPHLSGDRLTVRELTDGEFVTVLLEGVQPVDVVAIPRSAVLSDQQGEYVFVLGADNKAEQRRIQLGQSTATIASVTSGLSPGEKVIVEGFFFFATGAARPAGGAGTCECAAAVEPERGRG